MDHIQAERVAPFVWALSNVDLSTDLSDSLMEEVVRCLHGEGAVLFRDQDLTDAQQIAFARRLGKLSGHNPEDRAGFDRNDSDKPLQRLTNTEGVGRFNELCWHSDNQFTAFPFRYLMLYGLDLTTDGRPLVGGETGLASAANAADRLPQPLRDELSGRLCRIDAQERGAFDRPCIDRHWASGRQYLAVSEMTTEILGLDEGRSGELIKDVQKVIYDKSFTHLHVWREGDLLVWDNFLIQHSRQYFDNAQTRVLRRTAVADDREPTALAV